MELREVIVRDRMTGRYHKGYVTDDKVTTFDACAVLEGDVVPYTVLELAEPEQLCYRDFPPGVDCE